MLYQRSRSTIATVKLKEINEMPSIEEASEIENLNLNLNDFSGR